MSKNIITDFTFGEISRKSDGRSDLGAYYKSCAELRNMYVTSQGVASRMPGTEFVTSYLGPETDYLTTRIVPFWIDEVNSFIIIFTPSHAYWLKLGTKPSNLSTQEIKDGSSNALTMTKAQIDEFQYVQIDKVLYFVHQDFTSCTFKKITYSGGSFTWANVTVANTSEIIVSSYGNPGACTSHHQRLILANFKNRPNFYAGSCSRQPETWKAITEVAAQDSFYCELTAGNDYSAIRWISSRSGLVAGTATKEVLIAPGEPITPSNASNQQLLSTFGSAQIQAPMLGLSILFVGRTKERLREFAYQSAEGSYASPDLTLFADDILEGGVKQMCFQNNPFECLFVLKNDGTVCMFTYDRDTGISAWSRLDVGGEVESITTIPGSLQDYTYIVVKRVYGSVVYRYIERFTEYSKPDKKDWKYANSCATVDNGHANISTYSIDADTGVITVTVTGHGLSDGAFIKIDGIKAQKNYSGVYYDAPCELNGRVFRIADADTDTFTLQTENFKYIDGRDYAEYVSGGISYNLSRSITGLTHLQGRLCSIVADGGVQADRTLDGSGACSIERLANIVQVGLPYTSYIKTNRLVPQAMGEFKRIDKVHVRFYRSLGCVINSELEGEGQAISFRENELKLESPGVYTGDKSIFVAGEYNTDGYIYLIQREPLPFNICAVGIDYKIGGR